MEDIRKKVERLLEFAPDKEVDKHSKKELKKRLYKWKNSRKKSLASLEYFINGHGYDTLLDGLYEEESLDKVKIKFLEPDLEGEWAFSRPTKMIKEKGGKGVSHTLDYDPTSLIKWSKHSKPDVEKVMIRGFISDYFVPVSIKTKSQYHRAEDIPAQYEARVKKLHELWQDVRDGMIPLNIRLSLYTKDERYPYILDVLSDTHQPHPLHKATQMYKDRKSHEPINYMHFDKVLATLDVPDNCKKIFELLFECGEKTLSAIAHTMNMTENIAKNSVTSLLSRDVVEKDEKESIYRVPLQNLKEMADEMD